MYIKRAFKPCRNYRNYVIQLVKSAQVLRTRNYNK